MIGRAMKRSEMIEHMVQTSLRELHGLPIHSGDLPHIVAEVMLKACEEKGMIAPAWSKPIPFESDGKQYPLVPGDFKNDKGIWCTPGYHGWEPENE